MWRVAATLLVSAFFIFPRSSRAQLPLSTAAPYVGQRAPDFTLPDQHGNLVSLANLLKPEPGARRCAGLVLIFYRGYW
jgi:cytochrome oxidase Cu insertion factor (SCO1/SenC/PrrC family)